MAALTTKTTIKEVPAKSMRDLIPSGRSHQTPSPMRDTSGRSFAREVGDPFPRRHREMHRLFDEALHGFDRMPFASPGPMLRKGRLGPPGLHDESCPAVYGAAGA